MPSPAQRSFIELLVAMGPLLRGVATDARLAAWSAQRTHRVASGFYTSQALELRRRTPEVTT